MNRRAKSNRHAFALLAKARITSRDDRIMLANQLLGTDIESFTDLTDADMRDLSLALNDWRVIQEARDATGATTLDAIEHLFNLNLPPTLHAELEALCTSLNLQFNTDSGEEAQSAYTEKEI